MAKRYGFGIALRRANSAGVGKMAPVVRSKKQVNTGTCPKCGEAIFFFCDGI